MRSSAALLLLTALTGATAFAQTPSATAADWSPKAAARYLDERSAWWMDWPKAARDHGTFCVSCHTLAPFALARPVLREALGETAPSPNENRMLENITHRVRIWKELEPFYSDQTSGLPKSSESRGTEAILNALILVWHDMPSGHLSADARLALDHMWALQLRSGEMNGSWAWLQFHNAPWEGDSQFYGTVLAAVAIGSAPDDYKSEPGIQNGLKLLRGWLQKQMTSQTPLDRATLLWASAKTPGILTEAQQQAIVQELVAKQQPDGGFSMSTLTGSWKRRDSTPLDAASDGYATGLVTFAFEQLKTPDVKAPATRAIAWLRKNQNESDGRWPASSLNKQRELSSEAGRFMSDAATAYAVLALESEGHR